jgi:hypothetical protein
MNFWAVRQIGNDVVSHVRTSDAGWLPEMGRPSTALAMEFSYSTMMRPVIV